jgi:creatinine amidohydrolase
MKTSLIANMTWDEYNLKIPGGIIILPAGAVEQHAKHLPLATDSIIAENIAIALAEKVGAVVAPTLSYGYKSQPSSGGGPLFPGTIDLNGVTLINLARDILAEFLADGWQHILLLNTHSENQAFLVEAADLCLRYQKTPFPKIIVANWWDNLSKEMMPKIFDEVKFAGWDLEHAAVVETSIIMHVAPELVRQDRFLDEGLETIPTYHCFPPSRTLIPESGCLHSARSSSGDKGRWIVENIVENLAAIVGKEFRK